MNLLFWILEIANFILLSIPFIVSLFMRTGRFLISKHGLYILCLAITITAFVLKVQCVDCYKIMMIASIPGIMILSDQMMKRLSRATEFNL